MTNYPPGTTDQHIDDLYDNSEELDHYTEICEWLTGVMEAIYVTGNTDDLENCLDELCSYLEQQLPKGEMMLTKKENKNE